MVATDSMEWANISSFIRVKIGQQPCVSARHCRQFIQLYQKTVYGSEVAFCIWRLGCCSRLVFHYFYWEKGLHCCKGRSYCGVSWLCNLHYKMAVPPWPELLCLTCLTLENGDITGFRTSTNMHLNIQRRNSICIYSVRSNENHWTRKITIDGSTHQLPLSVEDFWNLVWSTGALPSVYQIHYYVLENLNCIDCG